MDGELSQEQAPFFEELLRYSKQPLKAFHTPGHRNGQCWEKDWFRPEILGKLDLTEIPSLDWSGSLEKAEKLAASLYKADQSFFLTQGASQGILGAILGAFSPGDIVLVARNCHSSVIHGIILADLNPVYVEPEYLDKWGIPAGVDRNSLQAKLETYPNCKGLIITNPTYQGIAEPVKIIRDLIGERLLIIDEAHGGYLGWSGLTGFDAAEVGDLWIQGTHKLLGSLTQTGMLHLRKKRLDPERVKRSLELVTTTSQSYILLASLDSNRRFLATTGKKLFQEKLSFIQDYKLNLLNKESIAILVDSELADPSKKVDPWKLTISADSWGVSGFEVEQVLERDYGIQPEYADLNQLTFFIEPWQDPNDLEELLQALFKVTLNSGKAKNRFRAPEGIPPLMIKPREASLGPGKWIELKKAAGNISAAILAPYPPGIPLVGPGELIQDKEIDLIEEILNCGGVVRGVTSQGKILVSNLG